MYNPGHAYEWLVVVGAFGAFAFGFATGANDVANAFGTSVGSKALKLWQAVIIAAIFEFAGALVLGRVVTNTIAGGIADINAFTRTPEMYAYGMVCALFVGAAWQILASYMELNVSATHSIIGAILGFALVHAGSKGVVWAVRDPGAFPPYKGVVAIIMSWFVSPILTGLMAALIFFVVRTLVLRRKNAYILSFWTLPPFVCITVWVNVYFVLTKGARKLLTTDDKSWTDAKAAWIAAICAAGMTILTGAVVVPLLKRKVDRAFDSNGNRIVAPPKPNKDLETNSSGSDMPDPKLAVDGSVAEEKLSIYGRTKKALLHGLVYDIHAVIEEDDHLKTMHDHAEVFEPRIEMSFSYLQVFSACCVIFAHGAGEVGYMAGPLTTVWDFYKNGYIAKGSNPPIWIILIGALGLVIGLATYGYKVTRAMGVRLAKISPTRGFAAELATALIITIAAQYGLPTSSSQCITGAIVGVGLLEGGKGVNWKQFGRQFIAWMCTLAIVGLLTAALFAQGVYAPSEIDSNQVMTYEDRIVNMTQNIYKDMNTTLYSFRSVANENQLPRLSANDWAALNKSITTANNAAKALTDTKLALKQSQTLEATQLLTTLNKALTLLANYTVNTLGQSTVFPGANICTANTTAALNSATLVSCRNPSIVPSAYKTSFP
jgi:sodium-dependent phosphate transporter